MLVKCGSKLYAKKKLISVHKSLLFGRIRTQISHSRIRQPRCWKVFLEWTSHLNDHSWPFSPCLSFSICRPDHSPPSGVRSPQTLCLSFSLPWAAWISPSFFCCWCYLSLCFLSHPLFQAPNHSSMSWGQRPSPEQAVEHMDNRTELDCGLVCTISKPPINSTKKL